MLCRQAQKESKLKRGTALETEIGFHRVRDSVMDCPCIGSMGPCGLPDIFIAAHIQRPQSQDTCQLFTTAVYAM